MGRSRNYFFAVEQSGSRYLAAEQVSAADWARWMLKLEHRRRRNCPTDRRAEYLLWPADDRACHAGADCCARGDKSPRNQPPPTTSVAVLVVKATRRPATRRHSCIHSRNGVSGTDGARDE